MLFQFVPSSYGHPQNNASASSQFQPIPQMHAPVAPISGQPWASSANHSMSHVTPVQQTGQQPSPASFTDAVSYLKELDKLIFLYSFLPSVN